MSFDESDDCVASGLNIAQHPPPVTVSNLVFDENNIERTPWSSPCGSEIPRSEVIFISQISLIFLTVIFCIVRLSLPGIACEESTVYIAILTSCATYILPPPQRT